MYAYMTLKTVMYAVYNINNYYMGHLHSHYIMAYVIIVMADQFKQCHAHVHVHRGQYDD